MREPKKGEAQKRQLRQEGRQPQAGDRHRPVPGAAGLRQGPSPPREKEVVAARPTAWNPAGAAW
jgi:hypothetical protein